MSKLTQKDVRAKFKEFQEAMQEINKRGFELDFNSYYGGYRIEQIQQDGGTGVREVTHGRMSAKEVMAWMEGALWAVHLRNWIP